MTTSTKTTAMLSPTTRSVRALRRLGMFFRSICRDWTGTLALAGVVAILLFALFPDALAPHDPNQINPMQRFAGPSHEYWLGNDQLGRDVFSRLVYGTQVAMSVALLGTGTALLIGLILGLTAGYGPRWLDASLMLLGDAILSIPMILFALAIVTLLGASLSTIILIVAIFMMPNYLRVVRSQAMVIKQQDFVTAARAMGARPLHVVIHHLAPNLLGTVLVMIAMDIPAVVAVEAGLSFLGQGVQPPTPSWGTVLNDGFSFIRQAPHLALAAGLPIIIATLSFTFLGETLRDVFDPRSAQ